ncbi:MAG: serine/threonine protein kinase [Actinomycetia bacterium]|nr:serine/threonine protein kinase [Actinomycetes bacterium]
MKPKLLMNRYQIIEVLLEKKEEIIYKAFDTVIEREVIVKVLSLNTESKNIEKDSFKEAKMVTFLNHQNIWNLYDFEQDSKNLYLIYEHLIMSSLNRILKQKFQFKVEEAIAIVSQICHGLENAHINGISHLNLGLKKIFLNKKGIIKIYDFGLFPLRKFLKKQEVISPDETSYLSPEIVKDLYIGERSDLFSIAVIMYQLLTGKNPFSAETVAATEFKIINSEVLPPSSYNPWVPKGLDSIILKALNKMPERRYQNIIDFRYKIEHFKSKDSSKEEILKSVAKVEEKKVEKKKKEEKNKLNIFEAIKRLGFGASLFLIGVFFFKWAIYYPTGIAQVILLVIFLSSLVSPFLGLILLGSAIIPPLLDYSLSLGFLSMILLLALVPLAKKKPYYFILPFLMPFLSKLSLDFFLPFYWGLNFAVLPALFLSFFSILWLEIYNILSPNTYIAPLKIYNKYHLLKKIEANENLTGTIKEIFQPLAENPILFYQILIWMIVVIAMILIKKFGKMPDIIVMFAGFILLMAGYISLRLFLLPFDFNFVFNRILYSFGAYVCFHIISTKAKDFFSKQN